MKTVEAPAVSEHTKLRKDHQALVKRVKELEEDHQRQEVLIKLVMHYLEIPSEVYFAALEPNLGREISDILKEALGKEKK